MAFSLFAIAAPAKAVTLSEVLSGIADARKPSTLTSMSFLGNMALDINSTSVAMLPREIALLSAWRSPDKWLCTYELSGELATGAQNLGGGHPAVDHIILSRPDFLDILYKGWTVQYQGSAVWGGQPAWQLLFTPADLNNNTPGFNLYVRKDDYVPLRTRIEFDDGTVGTTDLTYILVGGVLVPSVYTTTFSSPIGPLRGYRTVYFNHEINPDLSGMEFPRSEGAILTNNDPDLDEGTAVFEELYHGFADDPIIAPLTDSSGTYDHISFTFSLYVEDPGLPALLNSKADAIRDLASDVISQWDWSGDNGLSTPGGKYECGEAIMDAIDEFLGTESITDFYFLDFDPLEPEN